MTVRAYRTNGATATLTAQGFRETVPYEVTGLEGLPPGEWMYAACTADGIPQPGSEHPIERSSVVVRITPEIRSADMAHVKVVYDKPNENTLDPGNDDGTVEFSATLQPQIVRTDVNGNQITVKHTKTIEVDGEDFDAEDEQGVELEVMRPQRVITIDRIERRDPSPLQELYMGTVNRTRVFGLAPHTVLCTAIRGTTNDRGETYRTLIELTVAPKGSTWRSEAVYVDPETGSPPSDLVAGEGIKSVQVYLEQNFGGLDLPSV